MWSELPQEILVNVFMCLNMLDLIAGVASTCRAWRAACKDPSLWERIDLTTVKSNLSNINQRPYSWSDEASAIRIMRFLRCALNLSCGAVSCLIFHFYVHTGAEDLIYVATRSTKIKRLVLPALNDRNMDGFLEAVKHWKHLESITVPCVEDHASLMKALGKHCKSLTHLKLMCPLKFEFAKAICTNLPWLKALSVRYTLVYKEGVLHILKNMEQLEVLNVSHILMVEITEQEGRESQVALHRELGCEIKKLASQLKTFAMCQNRSCVRCNGPGDNAEEIARWYKSEEESWRFDEVRSFRI